MKYSWPNIYNNINRQSRGHIKAYLTKQPIQSNSSPPFPFFFQKIRDFEKSTTLADRQQRTLFWPISCANTRRKRGKRAGSSASPSSPSVSTENFARESRAFSGIIYHIHATTNIHPLFRASSLFPREKERKRGGGGETFIRWRLVPRRFRNPRRESIFRDTREPLLQRPLAGNFWGIKSVNDDDDDDGRRNVKLETFHYSIRFENGSGIFRKKLGNLHYIEFEVYDKWFVESFINIGGSNFSDFHKRERKIKRLEISL